ncbi:MAG: hypothetical protein ACN6PO_02565 [Stenotrophomonas bentonitica]
MSALSAVAVAISDLDEEGYPVDDLREGLEAFAELIEAVSDGVEVAGYSEHGNAMIFTMERVSRLRAALARVKGGAA